MNGRRDLYIVAKNLMSDLIHRKVGLLLNCSVLMIGHCFDVWDDPEEAKRKVLTIY